MAQVNWQVKITNIHPINAVAEQEIQALLNDAWRFMTCDNGRIIWTKADITLTKAQRAELREEQRNYGRTTADQ